ncbi:MAG: DUF1128 domain-containing protein [Bacillales bacterium]|nr:DUF1128 domain-containing protein [Bacillales bacterium]
MDLTKNTFENIEFMVEKIKEKLKMVNGDALKPSNFSSDKYEELKEIYELVERKNHFSPNEMQAIAEELGHLRK